MTRPRRKLLRYLRWPIHARDARARLAALHSRSDDLEHVVRASLDLGSKGFFKVKAQQIESEIQALARRVAARKPRTVLEIGTARGGTLLIWAQLARDLVVTCDLNQPGYRRQLYARFPPPGGCRVAALAGDSHTPAFRERVIAELGGAPVDFLFIDGDHSLEGVTADYRDYAPLVRPGGLIAFHDIVLHQVTPSSRVRELWLELRRQANAEEIVEDPDQIGCGIGLLAVPE
jgi:predicted O-methyltransferase YrrM